MNQSEYVSAQLLRDAIRTRPARGPLRALLDQLGLLDTVPRSDRVRDRVQPAVRSNGEDGKPVAADEYQLRNCPETAQWSSASRSR